MEKTAPSKWNKYNTKSLKVPKGKEASTYYAILIKSLSKEEADRIYIAFRYYTTHGQNHSK